MTHQPGQGFHQHTQQDGCPEQHGTHLPQQHEGHVDRVGVTQDQPRLHQSDLNGQLSREPSELLHQHSLQPQPLPQPSGQDVVESSLQDSNLAGQQPMGWKPARTLAIEAVIDGGANSTDATAAVDAVAEAFSQYEDPTGWAGVAIIFLANEQIQQAEERQLAAAMEASRQEQKEAEAKELPIGDRPEEELRQRYISSVMLSKLDGTAFRPALFQAPLRLPLVQLLEFERQYCKLWYPGPGTMKYFEELGESLVHRADQSLVSCTALTSASGAICHSKRKRPPVVAPQKSGNKVRKGESSSPPEGAKLVEAEPSAVVTEHAGHAQCSSTAAASHVTDPLASQLLPLPLPPGASAWCAELAGEVQRMQEATAWMPSNAGEIPPFLAKYIPQNGEVVTLE